MKSERLIVTGGCGFMGTALASRLVQEGRQVVVFDQQRPRITPPPDVQLIVGDLFDEKLLRSAVTGCDAVVHLAAVVQTHGPASLFERVNVDGTRLVGRIARECGLRRMVFTSSVAVFDYAHGYENADENTPRGGRLTQYGLSKLQAEHIVEGLHGTQLATTIVRPGLLPFGPGDRAGTFQILDGIARRRQLLLNGGRSVFSTSYIENLVDGLVLCLDQASAAGETFHITDGPPLSWTELVQRLANLLNVPPNLSSTPRWLARTVGALTESVWALMRRPGAPPLSRYTVDMATRDLHFSAKKSERLLGYQPRVNRELALRRSVEWFLALQDIPESSRPNPTTRDTPIHHT